MKEPFNNLRCGFKYSLIALVLVWLLVFLMIFPVGGIVILVLPFVIIFVWLYGLINRYKAWKALGQKNIAYAVISSGALIVAFSFVFYWVQWIVPISAIAWMAYTFLESQGYKKLKKNGVDLSHSRNLSLAAILLFIVIYLILFLLFYGLMDYQYYFSTNLSIGLFFWLYVYFGMIPIPFLLSIPFLIASCILAMKNLEHSEHLKPHPVTN